MSHENPSPPPPEPDYSQRDPNATIPLSPRVVDALRRGNTIEAIKFVMETTGAGLLEAKALVEEIRERMPKEAGKPGQGLSPGQVSDGMGPGKWVALIAIVAVAAIAVVLFR